MGAARSGRGDQDGGRHLTTARVVPNIPTFAVDDGFWYRVPGHLEDEADVGRLVRVPLSGRRVRGWIVETSAERPGRLKDLAGLSGEAPVFGPELLQSLRWAANHYVAPLSVLLAKATPPNLPGNVSGPHVLAAGRAGGAHPLDAMVAWATRGRRRPARALVGRWQSLDWLHAFGPLIASGRSALVIAASATEVDLLARAARPVYGDGLIEIAGDSDADLTAGWEAAQAPGRLILGTPRTATWQVGHLGLVVVLEEGRRAMKERQTPTLHVREVVKKRSLIEGFGLVFFGPTPSVEVLAGGAEVTRTANRAWPLVEIVDRSEEPPGSGLVSDGVIAALRAVSARGGRCFVFTFRKMVGPVVNEINARLGSPSAGEHPGDRLVTVGTERDLAGLAGQSLVVASNVDGMLLGTGYRASEEALRQLARLANSLAPGPGHRMMAQVMDPSLAIVDTLRRGDPIPYLERVLIERGRAGVPPSTEMLVVEVRDQVPEGADSDIRSLPDAEALGPLESEHGTRWLLDGDLTKAKLRLREVVARWREAGATVRVDADPIDL